MAALAPAFAEPVLDAQSVFRAVMNAMARPGRVQPLACELVAPWPLSASAASVALALFDYETPVWLDRPLSEADDVVRWLRFHTGAPITGDSRAAAFAVIADAANVPDFNTFALGTPDYPDRSTTLILQVDNLSDGETLQLAGPGIDGTHAFKGRQFPDNLAGRLTANHSLFPRGIDLLFATENSVAAIPRSTHVLRGE